MKIYLDNNATTRLDDEVFESMVPFFKEEYGNAFSLHLFGQETGKAVAEARKKVADVLGVLPEEIIFTGSGTESDNLAIRGIARAYKNRGRHIIVSAIEHPGVKNTCKDLESEGYEVTVIGVNNEGVVDPEEIRKAIKDETILITVMHANNETGAIQPIEEIAKIAKENKVLFHVDAVQSMGKYDIKPKEIGIDTLAFTAHKFYGPKGIGALYVRNGVRLGKVITGGDQERKMRPGTTNTPLIIGLANALEKQYKNREEENKRISELRDYFEDELLKRLPEIEINSKGTKRLSGTSSITFKYVEGESILLHLSMKGIAVSSGSACSSNDLQASHVLLAMGIPEEFAHGTIRFSLGKYNTKEEIDYTLGVVVETIEKLRSLSPLWNEYINRK
ncbi:MULTISPECIES: cysteine desulfurase family protein [Fusobacterium]|uniref:cysteine desulfurase family protein n=1 Tax=Fusobacterium TaxID=848 RepID=UPI00147774DE|nr:MULTISPECIES: cysteine desulfurase family protein [Fusobacterium]NME36388.1 cysteine desulfurase [Fusobacterium sp. FSA-380-WT-3A]